MNRIDRVKELIKECIDYPESDSIPRTAEAIDELYQPENSAREMAENLRSFWIERADS